MFASSIQRGWQDTGFRLMEGQSVDVTCTGRYSINDQPRPWISEPQGVSIDYYRDMPLGCVTAILVGESGDNITKRVNVGCASTIAAPWPCSLWLQINDRANSRSNNDGECVVTIAPHATEP